MYNINILFIVYFQMLEKHLILFHFLNNYFTHLYNYFSNFISFKNYIYNLQFIEHKQKLFIHFQSFYSKILLKHTNYIPYEYSLHDFFGSLIFICKYIIKSSTIPDKNHPIFFILYIIFFIEPTNLNSNYCLDINTLHSSIISESSSDTNTSHDFTYLIKSINIDFIDEFIDI